MIPPRPSQSALKPSFTLCTATMSRVMLIDHYPSANGGLESRVSWTEGSCPCHLQDYRPAGFYELPSSQAALVNVGSSGVKARKFGCGAGVAVPASAVYVPNAMIQESAAYPAQFSANQFAPVQPANLQNAVLQQYAASGLPAPTIDTSAARVRALAPPPKRHVSVTEKACDVVIDLKRTIPAKVSLSYNVEYESDDVPRPDEELVNVSIRNQNQLGTQIPDNFAQLVGSAIQGPISAAG